MKVVAYHGADKRTDNGSRDLKGSIRFFCSIDQSEVFSPTLFHLN